MTRPTSRSSARRTRMKVPVIARYPAAWLALMTTFAACTLVPAARPSQSVATTVATTTQVTTPTRPPVTLAPSAQTATPTVAATASTTPAPPTAVPPSPSSRPGGEGDRPPEGLLLAGGPAVAGRLGTYCYGGICVDMARWPPKA